jgi:arylsulfatase A-like enzyme
MRVLLLEVNRLHLGYLGCYGNQWLSTPGIDRLAAEGIVFDNHFADQQGADLCSGTNLPLRSYSPKPDDSIERIEELANADNCLLKLELDLQAFAGVGQSFEAEDSEFDFKREELDHAAKVTRLDSWLCQLWGELSRRGMLEELAFCFTAKWGEALYDPARELSEKTIHLPLIVRMPGGIEAGRRVSAVTQPIDLVATFLELSDQTSTAGRSLLPLIRGEQDSIRDFAIAQSGSDLALRSKDWALYCDDSDDRTRAPRLYAKPGDRWEVHDVAGQHVELVEDLERALKELVEQQ